MKKILIVGSDESLLEVLKQNLAYRDYVVFTEADPQQTVECIRREAIDMLIIDLFLADANGGAISHEVKTDPGLSSVLVIILSESALETRHPSKFSCDVIIQKSTDIQPLVHAISRLFQSEGSV
jgi:CheY-like chemotaxis protein